jgi:hypothetical protein
VRLKCQDRSGWFREYEWGEPGIDQPKATSQHLMLQTMQSEGGARIWGVVAGQCMGNNWPEQRVALGVSHGQRLVRVHTQGRGV